jgi:hypothetical protein
MIKNIGIKIPFGLKNGIPVGVDEVVSGLACNCYCPSCNSRLQAKKGQNNSSKKHKFTDHFSHDPMSHIEECRGGFESAIHLMAKHLIEIEKKINLPSLNISITSEDQHHREHKVSKVAFSEKYIDVKNITLEKNISDIRPDIIGTFDNQQIIFEIAVTSFIDNIKKQKIRRLNLNAIEIDLKGVNYTITKEELRNIIIHKLDNKKWISLVTVPEIKKRLTEKNRKKILAINTSLSREEQNKKEERRKSQKTYFLNKLNKKSLITIDKNHSHDIDHKWFICEHCLNFWESKTKIDINIQHSISCPKCNSKVSTKPTHV